MPERGEKKKRQLALATKNAELAWLQRHESASEVRRRCSTLQKLQQKLDLVRTLPRRIECYDISNLMGDARRRLRRRLRRRTPRQAARYRRYKIKQRRGPGRLCGHGRGPPNAGCKARTQAKTTCPTSIVIDGGKAQLDAAMAVVRELRVDRLDVISLAKARSGKRADLPEKGKERVFKPELPVPIILDQTSHEMKLLIRIRDEAHRFAITYHRRLRAKSQVTSILEMVPGIGRQKARALLREFGFVSAVRAADDEKLLELKGMTPALVATMREFFESGGHLEDDTGEREED